MSSNGTTGMVSLRGWSSAIRTRSRHVTSARAGSIPLAGPLTVFVLGGLFGLLASYNPGASVRWLLWLVAGSMLYITAVLLATTRARLLGVAALVVGAATTGGLLLATQYRHLAFDLKFGPIASLGMISSAPFPSVITTHIDANAAAAFLEGVLPLAVALILAARGWQRLVWLACATLIGYGVLLSGSRGSWVALAAVALLAGFATLRVPGRLGRLRVWLAGLPLAGLVVATGLLCFTNAGQRVLASALFRATDRLTLYRNSLFLALDFPFSGIGPGATFGMVYSHNQLLIGSEYLGYAHNLLLAIWLAQGLLGLLGFGALLVVGARLIGRSLLRSDGDSVARIGWGAALGCTVALLHGLTDAPQYDTSWPTLLIIFLLFGVAIAAARQIDDRPLTPLRLGRRSGIVAAIVVVATLLLLGPWLLATASANVAAALTTTASLRPRLPASERTELNAAAQRWIVRGLFFGPHNVALLKQQGMLALNQQDFAGAITALSPALHISPADQSLRKALGYALIWNGRVDEGVQLLQGLDRVAEVRQELDVWPFAWQQQGRADLAAQAQHAATLMAAGQ